MIKKATYILSTFLSLGLCGVAFFVPFHAHAQAPLLLFGQGQVDAATSTGSVNLSNFSQSIGIGQNYITGPIQTVNLFGTIPAVANDSATVYIDQATSTDFSHFGTGSCVFDSVGVAPVTDAFFQLTHIQSQSGVGCNLEAGDYVRVTLQIHTLSGTSPFSQIRGSRTNSKGWAWCDPAITYFCGAPPSATSTFYASFSLLSNNFQIVPTTEASGVGFSGAVAFCNDAFASSTGIGSTIGNGACIAAGFLFIPTPASVSAFQDIPNSIQQAFPFSWVSQMRTILAASQASSTENFVNLSINFGTTTAKLGLSTVDIISTTTISKYLTEGQRNAIKALLAAVFYLGAASFIYRSLQNIWQTS